MKNSKKLKIQTRLSVVIIAVGTVLMAGKIYADSEPGAIPLFLTIFGAGWYFYTRYKIQLKDGKG
ncbi:hypothetical protein LQ318_13405 [Aliifodinibius salicampi]|uniref:PEP-CTERM protein-sorting domain-containing protein n=1 Tax=Fodinibius salicampi TaxID=1920655 RepID=A0ABT3Q1B5_9BACT|nr:hypothetical protein [Fodinibius salicampi]MCW9713902.1 hypothetical protein [Fodinibius salicampi]